MLIDPQEFVAPPGDPVTPFNWDDDDDDLPFSTASKPYPKPEEDPAWWVRHTYSMFMPRQLAPGVYEVNDFNTHALLEDGWHNRAQFPSDDNLTDGRYLGIGVCDSYDQVLAHIPELAACPDREFVLVLVKVVRTPGGKWGWRWHKWGEYIGVHTPTTEYLDDEPEIEQVFVFHIHERRRADAAPFAIVPVVPQPAAPQVRWALLDYNGFPAHFAATRNALRKVRLIERRRYRQQAKRLRAWRAKWQREARAERRRALSHA